MYRKRKRIFLVGASGVIGRWVHEALRNDHDVICSGFDGSDVRIDLTDVAATTAALQSAGPLDAVISTAGRANFAPLETVQAKPMEESVYFLGLRDKLMGQVNLALAALPVLNPGGSITLTSGTTSDEPIVGGSSLSMVNGALERWAQAAATELPNGIRLNVVSPSLVEGTPAPAIAAFPGFEVIEGKRVALAYIRSLESGLTGRIIRV